MNLTTNIQRYPEWAAYLKDRQPKMLIVWGRNDPLILPPAAEFVKQVVPAADLRYFDGGHFVLDEYAGPIAEAIIETFLNQAQSQPGAYHESRESDASTEPNPL